MRIRVGTVLSVAALLTGSVTAAGPAAAREPGAAVRPTTAAAGAGAGAGTGAKTGPVAPAKGKAAAEGSAAEGSAGERSAGERARRTGKPVEITELRTPETTVFVKPDGTFRATVHRQPVRVRTAEGWVPVDTTLVERPDGTVGPKAAVVPVAFSGGGNRAAPLVRVRQQDGEFGLNLAGRLPKPVLEGDTAVYRSVLPGVDIRLTAEATGYTPALVVHSATAARDPRVRAFRFGLHRKGTAAATPPSTMAAAVPFTREAAVRTGRATGKPEVAPVPWRVSRTGGVTVAAGTLAGAVPATAFPMTVPGPSERTERLHWMLLSHNTRTQVKATYWDSTHIGQVGRIQGDDLRWRSYYEMDTSAFAGKRIIKATFSVFQYWAESCTPKPVELWHIDRITAATTWDSTVFHRKVGQSSLGHGHSEQLCRGHPIGFDVKDLVMEAADKRWPTTSFALRAQENPDSYAARRYLDRVAPFFTDPVLALSVDYNTVPDRATDLKVGDQSCAAGEPATTSAVPRLSAVVTDADNVRHNQALTAVFRWWEGAGAPSGQVFSQPQNNSGTNPAVLALENVPQAALQDGVTYTFGVTADDGRDSSDGRPWCTFTVDLTPPTTPPLITSADFPPPPAPGPPIYTPGRFTVDARGDWDITGFQYGFGESPKIESTPGTVATDAPGGVAVIDYIADRFMAGFGTKANYLKVIPVDRAGNPGPEGSSAVYAFKTSDIVKPATYYGYWGADSTTGGTLLDGPGVGGTGKSAGPYRFDATISGTVTQTADRAGNSLGAVRLDGTTGHAVTAAPVARKTPQNTFGSLTAMGWVKLDRTFAAATVLGQDGTDQSGFALRYHPAPRSWEFAMPRGETGTVQGTAAARSVSTPQTGVWTHVAGVYDHAAGKLRLFVNGRQAAEADHTSTWYAAGPTTIGRGKSGGLPKDFWPGDLDDLQLYPWAATAFEVQHRMKNRTASYLPAGRWSFDEGSGRISADLENNGHTIALHDGTTWANPGRSGAGRALRLDGRQTHAYTAGPVARKTAQNTLGSFTAAAWVRLNSLGTQAVAVSQDGRYDSGFLLGYSAAADRWTFGMNPADAPEEAAGVYATAGSVPQAGVWTHLAGVYDHGAGTMALYVNGRPAGTAVHRSTWYPDGGLLVGRAKSNGTPGAYWPGVVDDVEITAKALTAAQVQTLAQAPDFLPGAQWNLNDTPADRTGHGHTLALSPGAGWTSGKDGSGLAFDGIDGHAWTAGRVIRPDAGFTVAAWVKLDALGRAQTIVSQDGTDRSGFKLSYDPAGSGAWTFGITGNAHTGGTVPDRVLRATNVPRTGVWTHLAGVYRAPRVEKDEQSGEIKLYVNGRLQAAEAYTSVAVADGVLAIGRARHGGQAVEKLAGTVDTVELRPASANAAALQEMGNITFPFTQSNQVQQIPDLAVVDSPLDVNGLTPDMVERLKLDVHIEHTYQGDLKLELLAPDGTVYLLEDLRGTGDVDELKKSYRLNAAAETPNGFWTLRIHDTVIGDSGSLKQWSLSAPIDDGEVRGVPWSPRPGPAFQVAAGTTTSRSVTVSGLVGNAPDNLTLTVGPQYSYAGSSLRMILVGPRPSPTAEPREYVLYDGQRPPPAASSSCARYQTHPYNLRSQYVVDASASPANGEWTLKFENLSSSTGPNILNWSLSSPISDSEPAKAPDTKFADPENKPITSWRTSGYLYPCGLPGTEAQDLRVAVDIRHPNRGDLKLELTGASRTLLLEDVPDYDTGEDVRKTYTLKGVAVPPDTDWTLVITDTRTQFAGELNEWSVQTLPSTPAVFKDGWKGENLTDVPIADDAWSESPITVETVPDQGTQAPRAWQVSVAVKHTHRGDLALYLEAPDGEGYLLENLTRDGGDTDDLTKTYTVNAASKKAEGVWKLRVLDAVWGDTGVIDSWSLTPASFATALTTTPVKFADLAAAESPLTIAEERGNAPNGMQIQAAVTHTRPDQLVVTLLAPDGSAYVLHDRKPVLGPVFAVDASAEALKGTWKLKVQDTVAGEAGSIDSWGFVMAPQVAWPARSGPAITVPDSSPYRTSGYTYVSGIAGNAPADLRVSVATTARPGNLELVLVSPDGTRFPLHRHEQTFPDHWTVNASGERANGSWELEATRTDYCCTAMKIDSWSLWSPVNQAANPPGPRNKFANGADVAIPDQSWNHATSYLNVSGITGNAAVDLKVTVDIRHPRRGDLRLELDGDVRYPLEDFPDGDTGADVFKTYELRGVAQPANRSWELRVVDTLTGNTGTVDGWAIQILPSPQATVPAGWRAENLTDISVPDDGTAESPVTVTGLAGVAPKDWEVSVALRHTYRGDLLLHLVAPDGTAYPLEDLAPGGDTDDLTKSYVFNGSSEWADGVWKLRVRDRVWGDTGHIDAWSLSASPPGTPVPAVAWPEQNGSSFTVPDSSPYTVSSYKRVTGIAGNAPADLRVSVATTANPGNLELELIAPDNTRYPLHRWGAALPPYWTVDASAETANGEWVLWAKRADHCCTAMKIDSWRLWSPADRAPSAAGPVTKFGTGTDRAISDDSTSNYVSAQVTGITGNAPADLRVAVDIVHPRRGELVLTLEAPDGTSYPLEDFPDADTTADVFKTYLVNASPEVANGTWYLAVRDIKTGNTGTVDGWSLNMGGLRTVAPGTRFENPADVPLSDNGTTESTVSISSITGRAPAGLKVQTIIRHSHRGDLKLELIAPDGTPYLLENLTGSGDADDVVDEYSVDVSEEQAGGTWRLRIADGALGDTGLIDAWSLTFPAPLKYHHNGAVTVADAGAPAHSQIPVLGRAGNAPADLRVVVDVRHPRRGDLILHLVAPDGTAYLLEDVPDTDTAADVRQTYRVDASAEGAGGNWSLRAQDTKSGQSGTIQAWSLQFGGP
ncbi:proprotein convertase P-domain-containing protein [Streptomyces qinzhouensis]|uniref:DNRLRE domain-containing protein n=1 Tax=Streptomyces qinzhouensis TaxID=2599401 RepID=A0A5B8JD52_9ACTN|nr:proprotein convertase P-domain-containing protein [Streptomyces qinzhouensis]QDY79427.1 DNRLRE domain-containing protein [Streptomyces qinzhouensis]